MADWAIKKNPGNEKNAGKALDARRNRDRLGKDQLSDKNTSQRPRPGRKTKTGGGTTWYIDNQKAERVARGKKKSVPMEGAWAEASHQAAQPTYAACVHTTMAREE